MEKLKGQDNYEDWDVKLLACLSTHGIDYVLTEPNPADIPVDAAANPHGCQEASPTAPYGQVGSRKIISRPPWDVTKRGFWVQASEF